MVQKSVKTVQVHCDKYINMQVERFKKNRQPKLMFYHLISLCCHEKHCFEKTACLLIKFLLFALNFQLLMGLYRKNQAAYCHETQFSLKILLKASEKCANLKFRFLNKKVHFLAQNQDHVSGASLHHKEHSKLNLCAKNGRFVICVTTLTLTDHAINM